MTTLTASGKEALDARIKRAIEEKKLPGFVIGVSNIEGEIYFNGGGPTVLDDPSSVDVSPDSVFWICSQTKMIAALAILKLIELGKVSYDTVVADYIPELRNPVIIENETSLQYKPAQTAITVKHLLNFSTGLFYPTAADGSLPPGYTDKAMHAAEDPFASFFKIIKGDLPGLPILFEPGTDFAYGWNSDVMGFLVQKVTGQTFEQYCKEHIFGPLGLQTSFYLTSQLRQHLVQLSHRNKDGTLSPCTNQLEVIEHDPSKLVIELGGVGLYSSARDYLKLLRHLLQINAGLSVPNPILSKESVATIFVPQLTEAGVNSISQMVMVPGTSWGSTMAVSVHGWPDRRKKGTAFWGGWAGTHHFIDPESGIAVFVGVQVCPYGDTELFNFWLEFEALIYTALNITDHKL